jgi:hypothetical protein
MGDEDKIYPRDEVAAAWREFQRLGTEEENWPGWAGLFTDDALYEEHNLGTFKGQAQIRDWIVEVMSDFAAMTLWIEWSILEGQRIGF